MRKVHGSALAGLIVGLAVSVPSLGTADPAAEFPVPDEAILQFFQQSPPLARAFETQVNRRDAASLREVFRILVANEAHTLSPVLKSLGVEMDRKELAQAIEEARSLNEGFATLAEQGKARAALTESAADMEGLADRVGQEIRPSPGSAPHDVGVRLFDGRGGPGQARRALPPEAGPSQKPQQPKGDTSHRNWRVGYYRTFGGSGDRGNNYFVRIPVKRFYVQPYVPYFSRSAAGREYRELQRETLGELNWRYRVDRILYEEKPGLRVYPIAQFGIESRALAGKRLNLFAAAEIGAYRYDTRTWLIQEDVLIQKLGPNQTCRPRDLRGCHGRLPLGVTPGQEITGPVPSLLVGGAYALKRFEGSSIEIIGDYGRRLGGLASGNQVRVGVSWNLSRGKKDE